MNLIRKHVLIWIAFIIGLPVLFVLDQYVRNATGDSLNLWTTALLFSFLLSFSVSIIVFGIKIRKSNWTRFGVIASELVLAVFYLYGIAFWSLTLPGADTL